jgi:NADH:ubiquinone oxidoreductase subunit 5 (subunit L)/multisubunit Na+/H+ antiporter MnhA subunit
MVKYTLVKLSKLNLLISHFKKIITLLKSYYDFFAHKIKKYTNNEVNRLKDPKAMLFFKIKLFSSLLIACLVVYFTHDIVVLVLSYLGVENSWFHVFIDLVRDLVYYVICLIVEYYTFFKELFKLFWFYFLMMLEGPISSTAPHFAGLLFTTVKSQFISDDLPFFFFGLTFFLSSTIISLFFLSHLGLYGVFFINLITIVIFWLSVVSYFDLFFLDNCFVKINVGKWFSILNGVDVYFEFFIDAVSYSFILLTVTIATAVYPYVYSYFRYEPNIERLSLLINLFVISMVILVMSGNLFVLFFGWEMIGVTSFLLINFWSTKISSLKSAFKAYTFNKLSDLSLFIAVIYTFSLVNDLNIMNINFQIVEYMNYYIMCPFFKINVIELISFCFVTAAFVKSAQFGFHIWLPDSMDAPVPASALIHSATLVSAGVFVLLRLTPLFEISLYSTYVIPLVGSFTAFIGGLGAAYQSDIKRILAYSTISHCGFLMVCFSLHVPEYTILYLYIHGFFKAAVFLCAGNIIRFSRNYQDFRKMGSFWKYLPFEFYCSLICLSNLCGLPFTLGFYIKHVILVVLNNNSIFCIFVFLNIFCAAVFGLVYSYKFFFYIFMDKKKTNKYVYYEVSRPNLSSTYYSNTTLAPIISISFLILSSFVISFLLFNCFLKKNSIGESLDINLFYNFSYLEFNLPSKSLLNNIGYFNWLIILTIVCLILNPWRVSYTNYTAIFQLNWFFILSFFSMSIYLILK